MLAIAAFVSVGAGAPRVVRATSAEQSCAIADALRSAREFDAALAAYTKLLEEAPDLVCAREGLARIGPDRAAASMATAVRLKRLGFDADATVELKKAIAADPAIAIPDELAGLVDVDTAGDAFQVARALREGGFQDEARAELQKATAAHPRATVPPDLRDLNPVALPVLAWMFDRLAFFGSALSKGLGAAIVVGYVTVLVLSALYWFIRKWELAVNDFDGIDATAAKPLSRAIQIAARKLDEDGGGPRIYVNDWTQQDFKMPDLGDSLPQYKGLSAILGLLRQLLPQKHFVLAGSLQPPGSRGLGLSLTLRKYVFLWTSTVESTTIWESDLEPWSHKKSAKSPDSDELQRLAVAAAVWVGYMIPAHEWRGTESTRKFVTRDWRSYACFALGTMWRDAGDDQRARRLFERAVEIDPANEIAWADLGSLDWLTADPHNNAAYARAMVRAHLRLERARVQMEKPDAA